MIELGGKSFSGTTGSLSSFYFFHLLACLNNNSNNNVPF